MRVDSIDQAIYESERELENGAEAVDAELVFVELEKNHKAKNREDRS